MNRFGFVVVSCALFSQCAFGMTLVRYRCKPVARNMCSQRPLKIGYVEELLATQKNISVEDFEDTRNHLHSLCNGYQRYLNEVDIEIFENNTPKAVQKDIKESIALAYRTMQIRGTLYVLLTAITSSAAVALALKSGDVQFLQEPLSNYVLVLTSLCSLTHSTCHTATKAHQYLIKTGANIEANIAWNTAILREHLADTAEDL